MELGLSLGDNSNSNPFELLENQTPRHEQMTSTKNKIASGICMDLSSSIAALVASENEKQDDHTQTDDTPVQLNLLPLTPVPRNHGFFWPSSENHVVEETDEGAGLSSSPNSNSGASSFQMDISLCSNYKRDNSEGEGERDCSRASDEDHDTNGNTRKKLRLSKDQSAFLEESFKEHNTLDPKQKIALAKQLKLRPRQVEVWFQNRRARTKLKQTEVDCEYLKRCCEKLTEENRKLHKELQELRILKTSNPFYKQLPATTLTMCPSCERVATTNTNNNTQSITTNSNNSKQQPANNNNNMSDSKAITQINNRPNFFPFSHSHQS